MGAVAFRVFIYILRSPQESTKERRVRVSDRLRDSISGDNLDRLAGRRRLPVAETICVSGLQI